MARRNDEQAEEAYQKALQRIDREWEEERTPYLWRYKCGSLREPEILPCQIVLVVIPVALVGFFIAFFDKRDSLWLLAFGFVAMVLVFLWVVTFMGLKDAIALSKAREIYEAKRRNLRVEDFQADGPA